MCNALRPCNICTLNNDLIIDYKVLFILVQENS